MDVYKPVKSDQINQPVNIRTILSKGDNNILYNGHDEDEIRRSTNHRKKAFCYERKTRNLFNVGFKTDIKTTLLECFVSSFAILLVTQLSIVSSLNIQPNEVSHYINKTNTSTPTLHALKSINGTSLTNNPVDFINQINFTNLNDGPIAHRTKRYTSSSGTFVPPTSSNRINMLENEIRKVQSDITKLKTSLSINSEDSNRLATLETSLEMLQKMINDHRREQTQNTNSLESLVTQQIGAINSITNELNNIKRRAEEQQIMQIRKGLPEKCILAIKSHDFASAENILEEINDYSKINFIVNSVYNHQEGNFGLVLNFGQSLYYLMPAYYVYNALYYELETNGHKNPYNMIKLARIVRNIINNSNTPQNIRTHALSLEFNLKTSIKLVMKEKFKTALLNNNFQFNSEIKQLSNEVQSWSSELFEHIYRETVREIYDRLDTNTLLRNIRSHGYIEQVILGLNVVFDKMGNAGSDSIFLLANYVKQIIEMENYYKVVQSIKDKLERIKNGLPKSVRNVVFSSVICIRNVYYNEYLYAPGYGYDSKRRHVFTWIPGGINSNQRRWILQKQNDYYYIKNVEHPEYLFADYSYNYDNNRRRVFTWMPGRADGDSVWQFERNGDYMYIKNVQQSEYLYAAGNYFNYDKDRRSVFTWIPGEKVTNGVWSIEDCS